VRRIGPDIKSLSRLAIGSLTLTPAFDPETLSYTAETTNGSNKVTAEPTDPGDTVTIMNGLTQVANGTAATWQTGENILTITVADEADAENVCVYTVTVTK